MFFWDNPVTELKFSLIQTNGSTAFWNETGRLVETGVGKFFGKISCNEFFTVKFPTVFKLLQHCVTACSNFATVTIFIVFKMSRHLVNVVLDYFLLEAIMRSNQKKMTNKQNKIEAKFDFIVPAKNTG